MVPPKEDHDDDNNNLDFEDAYDDIPLQHKRPFGAGLHKQRITFVPASDTHLKSVDDAPASKPPTDIADLYLSLVLPTESGGGKQKEDSTPPEEPTQTSAEMPCPICKLPVSDVDREEHEASFAHQVCLPHSHPPSALDRTRMGLNYLATHGWDPDSRKGLGFEQQGIQYPIKAKVKDNKLGLGIEIPKGIPPPKEREKLLDAKQVRKMVAKDKRKAERLHKELFGDNKLEKYLGL
ncbi:protein pxr1 [Podospora fimiseda]|uniref:Protein pxr1 n=1 Tax=Podospora fimiseda TaxID=252190 RepID=A0AAN7BXD4_9PEZI|nr:protein pxr1 [Podospora fimiseda]